jgi:hypothetical protein
MIRGGRDLSSKYARLTIQRFDRLILPERKWADKIIYLKVPCFEFSGGIALKVISLGGYIQVGGRC